MEPFKRPGHAGGAPRVDQPRVRAAIRELLLAIGEDPERQGLVDTPARVARMWTEFIEHDAGTLDSLFDANTGLDGEVTVSGMKVWSLCEHHLLPFWCSIDVTYRPNGKVLGLSKFARIAAKYAHRLQLQEQLVAQVAQEVADLTGSAHVEVTGQGEHLCMIMRGARCPASVRTTSIAGMHGAAAVHSAPRLVMAQP